LSEVNIYKHVQALCEIAGVITKHTQKIEICPDKMIVSYFLRDADGRVLTRPDGQVLIKQKTITVSTDSDGD
jgi:hypothetical protein